MMDLVNRYTPTKRIRGIQPKEYTANLRHSSRIREKLMTATDEERSSLLKELKRLNRERLDIPAV